MAERTPPPGESPIYWGGKVSQLIAPRTHACAEMLFDLLNDDLSPYDSGDPIISFGIGVGFQASRLMACHPSPTV